MSPIALKLKIPVLGGILMNLAVARFCRVLGTLLGNGVPILKSLEISGTAAGNRLLRDSVTDATENIRSGESLASPLRSSGHFPPSVVEMISVGEESNSLDTVLPDIADSLEKMTFRRLDLFVTAARADHVVGHGDPRARCRPDPSRPGAKEQHHAVADANVRRHFQADRCPPADRTTGLKIDLLQRQHSALRLREQVLRHQNRQRPEGCFACLADTYSPMVTPSSILPYSSSRSFAKTE